jgi:hypothetical protein
MIHNISIHVKHTRTHKCTLVFQGLIGNVLAAFLFLQAHRETDRFFAASGVQVAQTDRDQFHFRRAAFSQQLKSKVGLTLVTTADLRINLNLDGTPHRI